MDTHTTKHELTDYIYKLVECKARQLVGKARFRQDDFADIKQDLFQDLIERLPLFDPAKASLHTFADRIVTRRCCNLLRDRHAGCRDHRLEAFSLDDLVEAEDGPAERHETVSQDEADLRSGRRNQAAEERAHLMMDVNAVVANLPPKLRRAAELLRTESVVEAARIMGVPRRTMREKYVAPLRAIFAEARLDGYLK